MIKILQIMGITIAPAVLTYLMGEMYKERLKKLYSPSDSNHNQLIFTTFKNRECRDHIYKSKVCSNTCSYQHLCTITEFMSKAEHSISLCMCLTTCTEIHDALISAHNKGIEVRLITDNEMAGNRASRTAYLQKSGIPVKVQRMRGNILHHKYCVVDENHPGKARLFFGSLNLTCQGLTSNWDVIVFINDPHIVQRFSEEFEYLWNVFINFR